MAHEIEISSNGQASFMYVGSTPWHGLGQQLNEPPTVQEAYRLAGLNWSVTTEPLFSYYGASAGSKGAALPISTHKAVVRDSDKKVLGIVGKSYKPVQNLEAFEWFNPAIEAGLVSLETAGSLRGGSRVFVLAKINNATQEIVKGDPINPYFLLSNSHDGSLALQVGPTAIRVVCMNTLRMATCDEGSGLIKIRHTKNVTTALEKLREIVDFQQNKFRATMEQMSSLARLGCNEDDLKKYVTAVFEPELKTRKDGEDEEGMEKSVNRIMENVLPLFYQGKGSDIPGVRGTMYGAYNAVTEYLSWERGRENDTRLESLWFGSNRKTNERAFEVAMRMAA